ncbi:MAG: triose-phosphate isomerase [bacterium]
MRKPIVAGNWKMYKTVDEAVALASAVKLELQNFTEAEVIICPPFTALKAVGDALQGSYIKLGAQNMHWEKEGAFTGEISPAMLRSVFCHYVILGHSERRALFNETNEAVNRKVKAALAAGLKPIVCVGETLAEREAGRTNEVVRTQLEGGLAGIETGASGIILAYEPVWAIGTGKTASPAQAQEVHAFLRSTLAKIFGDNAAANIRIQYGGSVKPANARELFSQPDIDGGLIGGAALEARSFVEIVKASLAKG